MEKSRGVILMFRAPTTAYRATVRHVWTQGHLERAYSQQCLSGSSELTSQLNFKHQCDAILGARLGASINFAANGERWLIEQIAPRSKFFIDVG